MSAQMYTLFFCDAHILLKGLNVTLNSRGVQVSDNDQSILFKLQTEIKILGASPSAGEILKGMSRSLFCDKIFSPLVHT